MNRVLQLPEHRNCCNSKQITTGRLTFRDEKLISGGIADISTLLPLLLFVIFFFSGCDDSKQADTPTSQQQEIKKPAGCRQCHDMRLDKHHQLECTSCHKGDDSSDKEEIAHTGLISQPAHPENMHKSCGECHQQQVDSISRSLHLTLSNSVNMVRHALGADDTLASLTDIPIPDEIETVVDLGDDLLRRRCLRCHLYFEGDNHPGVRHATGCGSCHLDKGLKKGDHSFLKPPSDDRCLQCHYGNRVGFDYYGRFEQDLGYEYQTPFHESDYSLPQFGILYHRLAPDIHFQKGLICIDCHSGSSLMAEKDEYKPITCRSCHDQTVVDSTPVPGLFKKGKELFFRSKNNPVLHPVPLMTDPAHEQYNDKIDCQVCHAQWSFLDQPIHLLRNDLDEYDQFYHIANQISSEVSDTLLTSFDFEKEDPEPFMSDKITGEKRPGLWYKGFGIRRWESVLLGRDSQGKIRVMRPMLDLQLSWINEDETVRFDSVSVGAGQTGLTPYTPHTTGKAGLFYHERLQQFLDSEKQKQ